MAEDNSILVSVGSRRSRVSIMFRRYCLGSAKPWIRFNVVRDVVPVVGSPVVLSQTVAHEILDAILIVIPFLPPMQSRNRFELRHRTFQVANVSTQVALAVANATIHIFAFVAAHVFVTISWVVKSTAKMIP